MNLIKKTVILTDSDAEGYVSVIRVGNDVGAKIVGAGFKSGMRAGIKIGGGKPIFAVLAGEKTEISLPDVTFQQNDVIGCAVVDGEKLVARGGSGIKPKDVIEHFEKEVTLIKEPLRSDEGEEEENVDDEGKGVSDEEEKASFLERLAGTSYGNFYIGIREKLDELFVIYPQETNLNRLIPESEWIKINYENDDYYVVGKLNEKGKTVLIGYGVPGKNGITPPKIADEIASYLAVDGIKPNDGFWLIFQDAATGKIVPAK